MRPAWLDVDSRKSLVAMSSDEQFLGLLLRAVGGNSRMTVRQTVELLYRQGLFNKHKIEQYVVRERVRNLCERGIKRCDAMAQVANERFCSYEKIRSIIYQKN